MHCYVDLKIQTVIKYRCRKKEDFISTVVNQNKCMFKEVKKILHGDPAKPVKSEM